MIRLNSLVSGLAIIIFATTGPNPAQAQQFWTPANIGLVKPVTSLAVNSAGVLFAGVPDDGIYRSTDDGQSWTLLTNPAGFTLGPILGMSPADHIFVGAGWQEFRSTTNGDSWETMRLSPLSSYDPPVMALTFTPSGRMFIATGGSALYISMDDGKHWSENTGVFSDGSTYPTFVACGPRGTIFAAAASLLDTALGLDGMTWGAVPGEPAGGFGENIGFAYNLSGDIVMAGSNGVYRSTDNGGTWMSQIGPADLTSNYSIALGANGYIFKGLGSSFGGSTGLSLSVDHGANWTPISAGLLSDRVYAIRINRHGYVFAATDSGVFRYIDPTGDVKSMANTIPANCSLDQSFPNPATSSATIRFGLVESTPVSLVVYDATGREVAQLATGEYRAGTYEAAFDTRGLTRGVYYYKLQAGAFSQARTLIIAP
ncbi:MAG: T9SS type A sorting domain-containing protein [Bacteroidota bacterium]|nr:T9SS type A sorting domain-containing protein [Bacteroidota bacterium]MDP4232839.1 T9SS type A sorting domain-containing protein [Bacteroidota bacterium]MDP4241883.1 T9SS type A sorting domain-containing protein [Bacteroidota bacterium]MDP4288208.1 T9SS type A sorting domain-containing protein [Bacteroidota bacterium]